MCERASREAAGLKRGGRAGLLVLAIGLSMWPASRASGQILSPGKLSEAHASLEGVRSCTSCHEPGQRGASSERCLACHEPLARRIAVGKGYHARVTRHACAECHREHFGRDFALVRLDTARFDHATEAGFALRGAHAGVACADCHVLRRVAASDVREFVRRHGGAGHTMLGLPTTCAACHAMDDPHGDQFGGRACEQCHDEADWRRAPKFDHRRSAFPLTGLHRDVACSKCHPAVRRAAGGAGGKPADTALRFRPVEHGSCDACHTDEHRGAMAGACSGCHTTEGWSRLRGNALPGRFDHSLTRFPLHGAHARLECPACHSPRPAGDTAIRLTFPAGARGGPYPKPAAQSCASCHLDAHGGAFRSSLGGALCSRCHEERGWTPTTFGPERHDSTTGFALTGAHVAVACDDCHRPAGEAKPVFRLAAGSCRDCHARDDPHGGRYGTQPCESCHRTTAFRDVTFDHSRVRERACADCHTPDSPHGGQFANRGCDACHVTGTFAISAFDHDRTRFPLTGAHARVACAACHRPVKEGGSTIVRYTPLPTDCAGCHAPAPASELRP